MTVTNSRKKAIEAYEHQMVFGTRGRTHIDEDITLKIDEVSGKLIKDRKIYTLDEMREKVGLPPITYGVLPGEAEENREVHVHDTFTESTKPDDIHVDYLKYLETDTQATEDYHKRLVEEFGIPMEHMKMNGHKPIVKGVGKDEPRVVNERGGSQSKVHYRFDLLDPKAMFEMTKVLAEGAEKYGENNWKLIDVEDHLNHLLIHVYAYLAGDRTDDHLSHAMCRAMFAMGVELELNASDEEHGVIEKTGSTPENCPHDSTRSKLYPGAKEICMDCGTVLR
jgi:hypothetical protein